MKTVLNLNQFYTMKQAVQITLISRQTIMYHIKKKHFTAFLQNKKYYILKNDIDRYNQYRIDFKIKK